MDLFDLGLFVKHQTHVDFFVCKLVVLHGFDHSARNHINSTYSDHIIKPIHLFLEEGSLDFCSRLIDHVAVHQLSLASVIVPSSSV